MTLEEAVEIVLQAEPFTPCTDCLGTGFRWQPDPESVGMRSISICKTCKASGWVIVLAYKQACELLDRPMPTHTPRERVKSGAIIIQGIEGRVADSEVMAHLIATDQASRTKKSR